VMMLSASPRLVRFKTIASVLYTRGLAIAFQGG
jgi:hypothetical protein